VGAPKRSRAAFRQKPGSCLQTKLVCLNDGGNPQSRNLSKPTLKKSRNGAYRRAGGKRRRQSAK